MAADEREAIGRISLDFSEHVMRLDECLPLFDRIGQEFGSLRRFQCEQSSSWVFYYDQVTSRCWVAEAGAALASVFPPSSTFRQSWGRLETQMVPGHAHGGTLEQLFGIFQAAKKCLNEGRIGTLVDGIRAETVGELLDQAQVLLDAKHLAAAVVIAGGALETHLKHLVDGNELVIVGDGSIAAYNDAVSRARKGGRDVYSVNDGKQVLAWGGMRNAAAHGPGKISYTAEGVELMIGGIRQFLARTGG